MKIGLIDVDGHNFVNLPLMKLAAYHKQQGDSVEWYQPLFSGHMDKVYMSKVFTFSPDYQYYIEADEVIKSGTGYYYPDGGQPLLTEVEYLYPDYSLYPDQTKDTAYGFLTRGCPRGCPFCIVGEKEGRCSVKVADLSTFWREQRNIVLLDPNITACPDWKELFQQLIDSKAWINFSQGLDIRLITPEKTEMIMQMKMKQVHFAWDNYADKDIIIPKLREFKKITGWDKRKMAVYVLTNYDSNHLEDLDRIYRLKILGYHPYIMVYEKDSLPGKHVTRQLQRWVNNRRIFETTRQFKDYNE